VTDATTISTTTTPAWLQALDERCQPYLQAMIEFPRKV
jgi:hypothetical protein